MRDGSTGGRCGVHGAPVRGSSLNDPCRGDHDGMGDGREPDGTAEWWSGVSTTNEHVAHMVAALRSARPTPGVDRILLKDAAAMLFVLRTEVDRLRAVVSVARWIQADLKANEGRVSIEREADLDDALIDLEVGAASQEKEEKDSCPTPL